MRSFQTTRPVHTVLDIPAGRIQVIAAERAEASVEVRPADPRKSRDVKAAEQTSVTFDGGVLRIAAGPAAHRVLGSSGYVEVTVQVPAGSGVEATTAAAEFRGVGRLGHVAVTGAQGRVKLDEAAGATLSLQAGDIQVGCLTGPAELSTKVGDIAVGAARGLSATLDASTSYGRVHNALATAGGSGAPVAIRATTARGDITARSL